MRPQWTRTATCDSPRCSASAADGFAGPTTSGASNASLCCADDVSHDVGPYDVGPYDVAPMMSDEARTSGRPRCLVLLPRPAWPLDDGGRVGLWQGLRDVAGAFETRALVMRRAAERDEPVPAAVRERGIDVTFV